VLQILGLNREISRQQTHGQENNSHFGKQNGDSRQFLNGLGVLQCDQVKVLSPKSARAHGQLTEEIVYHEREGVLLCQAGLNFAQAVQLYAIRQSLEPANGCGAQTDACSHVVAVFCRNRYTS